MGSQFHLLAAGSSWLTHVLALDTLPFHHKDPSDHLLIAQSIEENLTLVSVDWQLSAYSPYLPLKLHLPGYTASWSSNRCRPSMSLLSAPLPSYSSDV